MHNANAKSTAWKAETRRASSRRVSTGTNREKTKTNERVDLLESTVVTVVSCGQSSGSTSRARQYFITKYWKEMLLKGAARSRRCPFSPPAFSGKFLLSQMSASCRLFSSYVVYISVHRSQSLCFYFFLCVNGSLHRGLLCSSMCCCFYSFCLLSFSDVILCACLISSLSLIAFAFFASTCSYVWKSTGCLSSFTMVA